MRLEEKTILVTGGAGLTGANLLKALVARGLRARATLHDAGPVIDDDRIEYVRCDLGDARDCRLVCEGMDVCFHCAAVTAGAGEMTKRPLFLLEPNVVMNLRLLEAAQAAGMEKFLFISSNTVYPVADRPMAETDATGEYFEKYFAAGWMKRFCEAACEMYATKIPNPMETVVVRPANLYGPMDNFDLATSHVLPALMRKVIERHDPLVVWGDGLDIKDFLFVEDYVEGLIAVMERLPGFDVVNLASGRPAKLRDLLGMMLEIDGYTDADVTFDASKPTMIPFRLLDPSKAERLLGFTPATPIRDGLAKTMAWYRSQS